MKKLMAMAVLSAMATSAMAQDVAPIVLTKCDKPITSLRVGNITCKAANCTNPSAGSNNPLLALLAANGQSSLSGIGDGVRDMMTTAMVETGCFVVNEREMMDEINAELKLAGKEVKAKEAKFILSGSVTQIDIEKDTTNIGWGMIPIIGSIGTTKDTATVSVDLRLIDVGSATVLTSKKISSTSENRNWGVGAAGYGGGIGFGGAFSALKGTNLEAVTRDVVYKSVNTFIDEIKSRQ